MLDYDFMVEHRPCAYHQAADTMSLLPKLKSQESDDSVHEDIPAIDIGSNDHRTGSSVLHIDQDPDPMPFEQEMKMAQISDPYCRNIREMVGTEPSWIQTSKPSFERG